MDPGPIDQPAGEDGCDDKRRRAPDPEPAIAVPIVGHRLEGSRIQDGRDPAHGQRHEANGQDDE